MAKNKADEATESDASPKQDPVEQKETATGQSFIPGTGPAVIEELVAYANTVNNDKEKFTKLKKKIEDQHKPEMKRLSRKYMEHFVDDESDPEVKWYVAGGVKIKYTNKAEEEVSVSRDAKTVNVNDY